MLVLALIVTGLFVVLFFVLSFEIGSLERKLKERDRQLEQLLTQRPGERQPPNPGRNLGY